MGSSRPPLRKKILDQEQVPSSMQRILCNRDCLPSTRSAEVIRASHTEITLELLRCCSSSALVP